jgi:hypothetical protein
MKPSERLRDYTNQFFENRNTCVGVRGDQVVEATRKVSGIARSLIRTTSLVP